MPPLTRHPRSSVRPALAALILAACPTLVAACIETPAPYSEAEFQDIVTRSPDTSVPPLTCPADDPQCECTVLAHCAAIACQSNTACEDRRCVRRAKPDCETCAVPRDCPDDGDLCRPAACNLVAGGIGECARTDLACDDHRTCTANRCDPAQGCVYDDSCDPPRLTLPLTATTLEGDWSLSGTFAGTTADGETFRAEVDWGEGQGTQPLDLDGTTLRLVHAWKEPGTFDVKVRVIDSFERSGEATVAVTVDNAAPIVTVHQAPSSIDEGASFGFEGTVLDPGGNVGLVGEIDFGDGSAPAPLVINASGDFTAPTHRFGKDSNSGAFDVVVTIADLQGRTGQASHRLTVRNVAPRVGKPLSPPTLLEGTTTTLKLALIEPGDDPLTGTINIGTETASFDVEDRDGTKSLLITLRYPNDGPQTVSYNLRDDDGAAVADSFVVNVANVAPAIVALDPTSLPLAGQEGAPLTVSLAFTDPGADQAEWRASVDWGDGTPASPVPVDTTQKRVTLSHTYRDNGDYTVRLTVSDAAGSDVAALPVAIANTAPKPNLGGNETLAEGATWTRSGTVTDAGQDTFSGSLAIADGPAQSIAIAADGAYALSHRFTQDGTYPIAFTVTDDDGTAATAHATLTVTNVAPSIDCGGTVASIPEGQRLTRPCSVTDPGADLLTAQVDYGEGTGATPMAIADGQITLDHRWADAAPSSDEGAFYRVTIRVADDHTATELVVRVAVGNVPPAVDVGPDQEILEGASLAATGHVATAVEDDPVDAVVAWGDGQSGPLPVAADGTFTLAHRYVQDGVYTVRVTVVDGDGDVGTDTLTVTVGNVVPVVSMGPAANLVEGGTLTRTVQVVDPGTLDTLVATIDSGRGTALTTAPVAPDGTLALALPYPQDGTYTVRVEVSDGGEVDGVGTLVVSVANVAPTVADIAAQEVDEGALAAAEIVVTDPGAETFALAIAWGDGQTDALDGTVARYPIAHRYADDGTYEVTAEVSDGVATTATRFAIRVANVAPIFVPGALTTSHEGSPWTLTGTVADVGLADTFTGEVRWSAGTAFTPFDAARGDNRVAHTYPQEGSYPVTVRVQDDDGALVEVAVVAQVDNVAPTFTLGADATVDEGATFTRSVTFADPGADTWLADLDYGDGATAHLPVAAGAPFPASHAYRDEGTYVLSLAVYDGTATTHDTMAVTVRNVAPTVNVGGPVTIGEGGTLLRQGSVTDPGLDDALTATIDWGEGLGPTALPLTGRDLALAHTYPRNGIYLVTVTATDDSGATGHASFQVTVSNSAPAVQAGANATLTEGDTFERVIAFTDAGSNAWTATVDWGDGTPLEAAPVDGATKAVSLVHRFRRDGVFTVTVSVFDGVETGSGSFIATVQNAAPVVSLGAAATPAEGALFARQGTLTDLGPDDVHTGTVSYGDGTASEPLVIADRAFALSHAYADNGSYDVVASIDDGRQVSIAHLAVTVTNVAPTLATGVVVPADEGSPWTWVGTVGDASPVDTFAGEIRWASGSDFAPIGMVRGVNNHAHIYVQEGDYVVTVRAADDDGGVTEVTTHAQIANVAPSFALGADPTLPEGQSLARAVTFADPGADVWAATVDYGDGSAPEAFSVSAGTPFSLAHRYRNQGVFAVSVAIDDGTATTTHTLAVTVQNVAPVVVVGGAAALIEGDTFVRAGSFSDVGQDDTFTATVDWGEGAEPLPLDGTTFQLSHRFGRDGVFPVRVTVTDEAGASHTAELTVTVANALPVVSVGADLRLDEGQAVTRTVTFTDPGDDTWTAYVEWDDGSATASPAVRADKSVAFAHTYRNQGRYVVRVSIDDGTARGTNTFVVDVDNVPVTISAGGNATVNEGATFSRGGTFADPGLDDPHSGLVNWGDGGDQGLALGSGTFSLSHAWADDGTYPVMVRINDDRGPTEATFAVTVVNVAPTVTNPGVTQLQAAERWQRTVSFSDPGTDTFAATVDYGDGTAPVTHPSVVGAVPIDHTYVVAGTYPVLVTVTDDDGGVGQATLTVQVANVAPTVTAGPTVSVDEGTSAAISATFSDPGTNTHTAKVRWVLGGQEDAASVDAAQAKVAASHVYGDNGSYGARITVTDQGGLSGVATVTVNVANVAPIVNAGDDVRAIPDRRVQRTVTFTDPGDDAWTATVNWGDGTGLQAVATVGRTVPLDHTYTRDGTFTVTIVVSDDDGGSHQATFAVDARLQDCAGIDTTNASLWVGGAASNATSWHTADNWRERSVPTAATAVTVCANVENLPVISTGNANAKSIVMAADAQITVNASRTLTVAGDLRGGAVVGAGTVRMNASGATLTSPVPSLAILLPATLGGDVAVSGSLDVPSTGRLDLAGQTLTVSGAASVVAGASAGLVLTTPGSAVIIGGAYATSGTASASNMTQGTLKVRGAFTQTGATAAFISGGTAVVLDGTSAQTVSLAAGTSNVFANLLLDNAAGVTFATPVRIDGTFEVARGSLSAGNGATIELRGTALPIVGASATYAATRTDLRSSVTLGANYTLSPAAHTLVVREDGKLAIGTRTLTLGGNLTVYRGAIGDAGLAMTGNGSIVVAGTTTFDTIMNAVTATTAMTAGTLEVQGDLFVMDSAQTGAASLVTQGTLLKVSGASGKTHAVSLARGASSVRDLAVSGLRTLDLQAKDSKISGTLTHVGPAYATVKNGKLEVADVQASHLVFDACPLSIAAPTATTALSNTTFTNLGSGSSQLAIAGTSSPLSLTFSGLTFAQVPTSGFYVDGSAPGATLALTITASSPSYGTGKSRVSGAFTLSWGTTQDDSDGDGLSDANEYLNEADPLDEDSDGDGFEDGLEVALGRSPTNASSVPYTLGATRSIALPSSSGATKAVLANVSGDAKPEAIVSLATGSALASLVTIPGAGALTKVDITRSFGTATDSITVGNLVNSDAQLDLAMVDVATQRAYLVDFFGATWTQRNSATSNAYFDLDSGDIDNAAGDEVLMLRSNPGNPITATLLIASFANNGSYSVTTTSPFGSSATALRVGDLDGLNKLDVAVGGTGPEGKSVTLYASTGQSLFNGALSLWTTLTYAAPVKAVAIGDIDQDGVVGDLAVLCSGTPDVLYVSFRTSATPTYTTVGPIAAVAGSRSLSVGDLDGNGKRDLVTANQTDDDVLVFLQTNAGRSFLPTTFPGLDGAGEHWVVLGDLDANGKVDLVTVNKTTNALAVTLQP